MQPARYIREADKQSKLRSAAIKVVSALVFTSGFVLSGGVHEAGHIMIMELLGCVYISSIGSLPLRGRVQPLCGLSSAASTMFYISGYGLESVAAGVLSVSSRRLRWLGWLSLGLTGGLMFHLYIAGDLTRLSTVTGANPIVFMVGFNATALALTASAFQALERKEGAREPK